MGRVKCMYDDSIIYMRHHHDERVPGVFFDFKIELCGEAECAQHARIVFAEAILGRADCADSFFLDVCDAVKRINKDELRIRYYVLRDPPCILPLQWRNTRGGEL